jgi:hypothetical protein
MAIVLMMEAVSTSETTVNFYEIAASHKTVTFNSYVLKKVSKK